MVCIENCSGSKCPLKEQCLHYKSRKCRNEFGMYFYFSYAPFDEMTKTCKMLWKEK